jgi:hypothetical protein
MAYRWFNLQHLCLYAEEIQFRNELDEFRMENVTVRRIAGSKIIIIVPGLAESRPSLLVGDKISIEFHYVQHYGYIWEIHELEIVVSISDKLYRKLNDNTPVNVNFELNELPFKLMHQGINRIQRSTWTNLIHPLYELRVSDSGIRVDQQFNTELNVEQMVAVKSIVEKK